MIKNKAKAFLYGQMEGNLMVNGLMVSSMELDIILVLRAIVKRHCGKLARGLSGLTIIIIIHILMKIVIIICWIMNLWLNDNYYTII